MNFFHRIFAKEKNSARANNGPFFEQLEFRKSDWLDVFSVCLGKMYIIQSAVGKTVIGDSDWEVDFEHGIISFGKRKFPAQLIGTQCSVSNTWQWGWKNAPGFDEQRLVLADQTRQIGQAWGLSPLSVETFELDETFNGHNLSSLPVEYLRETGVTTDASMTLEPLLSHFPEFQIVCLIRFPQRISQIR